MLDEFKNLNFLQRVLKLKSIFAEAGGIVATGDGQGITRSGSDSDRSFQFIQLSDFIKDAYKYCEDLDILPMVSEVIGDRAVMTLYDATKEIEDQPTPLKIEISSLRTSGLGEMQGIGSQITFSRRYLWITFLDLCARDELDEGVYNEEIEKALDEKKKAEEDSEVEKPKKKAPAKPSSNMKKPDTAVSTEPVEAPANEKVKNTVSTPTEAEKTETVTAEPVDSTPQLTSEKRAEDEITNDIKVTQNYIERTKTITDKEDLILRFFSLCNEDPKNPDNKDRWDNLHKKSCDVIRANVIRLCENKIKSFETELAKLK